MIKRRNNIWSVLISKTGTKTSSAKVTIDGVDYPVTPARYTGATPLSSVVMNAMQTNIEEAIDQNADNIGGEDYDSTATYEEGDIVKYQGQLYICIEAIETAEDWDSTKWDATDVLSSAGGNEVAIGDSTTITSKTKIWINEEEGTDAYSEVVNSLSGNEIAKAPSVRAVNEALANTEIYSTEEVRIGTWINGKPLYRKTITISTLPNNGYNEYIIFTDTSVIDKCFLDEAHSYIDDNGNYLPCNFYYDTSNTITILITSAKKMRISTNRDRSNNTAEITINYTKTTD